MINATQIKKGQIIKVDGDIYRVLDTTHVTPGKGQALMQTKLRKLKDQSLHDYRFRSKDKVELVFLEGTEMEYLYQDGEDYVFMNTENYEQIKLSGEVIGDAVNLASRVEQATKTLNEPILLTSDTVTRATRTPRSRKDASSSPRRW